MGFQQRRDLLYYILTLIAAVECSQISSAMYDGYGLVGMLPSSGDSSRSFSYVAVVSQSNSIYSISSVFHVDNILGFGASVALGSASAGGQKTVIAAIGSKDPSGNISIFDVQSNCSSDGCSPVITYSSMEASNCQTGVTVVAGDSFVASSCSSNLLKRGKTAPACSVCSIGDLNEGACTSSYDIHLKLSVCSMRKGGQLIVSGMDAKDDLLAIAFCAVCTEMSGNTLAITHVSGFTVYKVELNGTTLVDAVLSSTRTLSCPQSVAINSGWVILGYPDEGAIDFYASTDLSFGNKYSYSYQTSVAVSEPSGFGTSVDCDENLVIASGKGEPGSDSPGEALIFQLGNNGTDFSVQQLLTTIPCISYLVQYNYTFNVNLYRGTIFIVTQDRPLISWGFDVFEACPEGTEWSSDLNSCAVCPPGQYKDTPNGVPNFDLCTPCPAGFYSTSNMTCQNNTCPDKQICPAGSSMPIQPINGYYIKSNPNPQPTDPLDFENTFYYSCYPYFIGILTLVIVVGIPLCCTWPSQTKAQKKLVTAMLGLNFYYYPTGEEENFFVDEVPEKKPLLKSINGDSEDEVAKKQEKRKRHIDQFLGSMCSYFFLCNMFLMIFFCVMFMSHDYNSSVIINLQTIDQSTTKQGMMQIFNALQELDSSPFMIHILLEGYNGKCNKKEISVSVQGCYSMDYQGTCAYNSSVFPSKNKTSACIVSAIFEPSLLDQDSYFAFNFEKPDFYAQQLIYNITTLNGNTTKYKGNSFLYGSILPATGDILRGNATVDVLTIISYVSNCKSEGSDSPFIKGMVRVSEEQCKAALDSFKTFSFLSTSMDVVGSQLYNNLNVSGFTFNVWLKKSPFYRNVQQSYYVSFGAILSVVMLAALDVYWLVEAFVPWLGYFIFQIQRLIFGIAKKL